MDTQLTSLTWPSPAKLNLFLYITGRRADGYHTLQTLFQFLDYGDSVTITPRTDGEIRLLTPLAGVPDEQNLVIRAARLLQIYAREHHLTADLPVRILPLKKFCRWAVVSVAVPPMLPQCLSLSTITGSYSYPTKRLQSWV